MNKVIVIGCPGSGKSTFSRKLSEIVDLPIFYLDMIWHKPDKTSVTREEFDNKLDEIMNKEKWIIDGNYNRTLERRLIKADTVFHLDFPLDICLEGAKTRIGQTRVDLPWIETEFDEEFEQYIKDFEKDQLPVIKDLLDKHKDDKNIIVFKNREEMNNYLASYSK